MNANVRKLCLDFGLRWLLPFQLLAAWGVDDLFLWRPELATTIVGGVMLSLQASTIHGKVALWRTLPVTRVEIGRARWWQMTGLPGIGIVAMMGITLALHGLMTAMGWRHHPVRPDAMAILGCLLLQFFYPVFLTLFSLAINFARTTRSPWAIAAIILLWAPWLLLLPHIVPILPPETGNLVLGLMGLIVAIVLYVTAPYWPYPIIQPMQLDIGHGDRPTAPGHAGLGGWASLCAMALTRPLLGLGTITALWITLNLTLGVRQLVVMQVQQFIPFVVILSVTQLNATGLRLLRTLPGSAWRLAAYLHLLPLSLLAAASCVASLVLLPWIAGTAPQFDPVTLSAVLIVSALALPMTLGLRQTAMAFVLALTLLPVPLIQFGWGRLQASWADERLLMAAAAMAIGIGFLWMHAQISRGMRAYRFQPYMMPRWRGT